MSRSLGLVVLVEFLPIDNAVMVGVRFLHELPDISIHLTLLDGRVVPASYVLEHPPDLVSLKRVVVVKIVFVKNLVHVLFQL
jgi:hypothetical protein